MKLKHLIDIKKGNSLPWFILTFVLMIAIFCYVDIAIGSNVMKECFQNITKSPESQSNSPNSHSVDLPLTTTQSCQNKCGPPARCYKTGHQCTSDIDCPGCQPYTPPLSSSEKKIPGNDDAGKLTFNQTPQYSPLTTGYGTDEKLFTNNINQKPMQPDFGPNKWIADFIEMEQKYKKVFSPGELKNMPQYTKQWSITGDFLEEGPYASNSTLPSTPPST